MAELRESLTEENIKKAIMLFSHKNFNVVKDPIEIVTLSNKAIFVRFGKSSANEMIPHEDYDDIFYSLDNNDELALLNIFDFSLLEEFLRSNSNAP